MPDFEASNSFGIPATTALHRSPKPPMKTSGDAPSDTRGMSTRAVHAGGPEAVPGDPVVLPVVQSATFFGWGPDEGPRLYSRMGNNPNQEAVATKIAALEGTESALLLSSGMAATAMTLLALTRAGEHVVSSTHLYGTTRLLLEEELSRRGVETTFVDPDDQRAWRRAIRPSTRVLFLEIPTNPTLRVFDPAPVAEVAAQAGAAFVVDATFASPANLRMAEHGADVIVQSATKYLCGHSDVIAGSVAGDSAVVDEIRRMMLLYGPAPDPHAAWLLDRGIRTLALRVERQNASALELARWLEGRSEVSRVLYPGLPSHPDHAVASRLLDGYGGMLSMVLEGGGAAADSFMAGLETALMAPSLGGVETLVSQPRYTSHVEMTPEEREAGGIPDGFVRISVGVEDVEDLVADFARALEA